MTVWLDSGVAERGVTTRAVVAAAGVFAPTSFARLRLLRQLHATGLLSEHTDPVRAIEASADDPAATGPAARRTRSANRAATSC